MKNDSWFPLSGSLFCKEKKKITNSPHESPHLSKGDDSNDTSCAPGMCSCSPPPSNRRIKSSDLDMIKTKTEALKIQKLSPGPRSLALSPGSVRRGKHGSFQPKQEEMGLGWRLARKNSKESNRSHRSSCRGWGGLEKNPK